MDTPTFVLTCVLIAATLPFVASIMSAFSPATRVKDIEGYFLFDRNLDIDSFLKTTVGYSLQVASIALFFYWTVNYGLLGPLVVCGAWSAGYLLMARAVKRGWLDAFLGLIPPNKSPQAEALAPTETIHGYIGERMKRSSGSMRKWGVLFVSLASVIGLGGTMMAEIDYSTQFFVRSIGANGGTDILNFWIEVAVLAFTILYVLWGGYKSAVFTDRFQVPVAYVAFSIFGFGLAALARSAHAETGVSLVICTMVFLFVVLWAQRRWLLKSVLPSDIWDRVTTNLTFGPVIVFGLSALAYLGWSDAGAWSLAPLRQILFPDVSFLGFGLWGTIALIFANGVWQFIDISSLQRLQSLEKNDFFKETQQHRSRDPGNGYRGRHRVALNSFDGRHCAHCGI